MKPIRISLLVGILLATVCSTAKPATDTCMAPNGSNTVQYLNSTVTLKILLVEFSDVHHRTTPSAYKASDFTNFLISTGTYVSPGKYSPDNQPLYGSMADWYNKMSSGNLSLTGWVVNNVANDVPNWVALSQTKAHYQSSSFSTFVNDAKAAAQAAGLNVSGLGSLVKLVIIYAGNIYWNGGLNPAADGIGGTTYIMCERKGAPKNQENSTDTFSRIAIHCHEFAHLLGIGHTSGSQADIMEAGYLNGYTVDGNTPPPFNPGHRALKGWINPTVISGQQQWDVYYSLTGPQVYRVNSTYNSDYFLFENRHFRDSMFIGTTKVPDYKIVFSCRSVALTAQSPKECWFGDTSVVKRRTMATMA